MVTHDSFVASYCKRVLIIKDGRLYQKIICIISLIVYFGSMKKSL